jgi:hypothetical protein
MQSLSISLLGTAKKAIGQKARNALVGQSLIFGGWCSNDEAMLES